MSPGDLVDIMTHHISGSEWTSGKVGVIKKPALALDKGQHYSKDDAGKIPPTKLGWWIVSVNSPTAKGGYAFAALPEKHLGPHSCTVSCPVHPCQGGA